MRKHVDMLNGSLFTGILSYTIPIILTSVLQLLFNAADLVIVGRFCGSISVAAVSATGAITALMVNFFIGLSVGAGVCVAHGLGGQNNTEVHRTIHTAIPTALIAGTGLSILGVIISPTLLRLMDTPVNVLPLSSVYMRIYFAGMIFNMLYNFSAAILRAAGDTKSPLIYLTFAGVINVILNVIFVTLFHMNVAGVALATTISQAISAILTTRALMKRTDVCRLELKKMHFYKKQFKKMLHIGLPAGIQSSLFSISNVLIQSSVNSFQSDAIMSGNGSMQNIESFVYAIVNSFSQTAVNYVGQNAGAHRFDRIKKIYPTCLGFVAVFGIFFGTIVQIFGRPLLYIYITDSPEAIQYGLIRMGYVCRFYFLCGMMDVTTGALRGLGSSVAPMIITVLGACGFRILWIYTVFQIPQYHTLNSLFTSYPISWILTFAVELLVFIFIYKKKARADWQLMSL